MASRNVSIILFCTTTLRSTDRLGGSRQGNGFPFAPVNDIKGTFAHPQAVARQVVAEVDHPRAGRIKLLAPAVVYNGHKMKVSSWNHLSSFHIELTIASNLG
jgi:crotonobetainyl-CoA:carnitine CoA-transferase CaiB-like acyl-CoA transferase